MIEWLRFHLLLPIAELLRLVPLPWRYSFAIVAVLLPFFLITPGILLHAIAALLSLLLAVLLWITDRFQRTLANRPASRFIDALDSGSEAIIQVCRNGLAHLKNMRRIPRDWGRPKMIWVLAVAVVPVALYFVRPLLGSITVGRLIDQAFVGWGQIEDWMATGEVNPDESDNTAKSSGNQPLEQPTKPQPATVEPSPTVAPTEPPSAAENNPVYTVQKGDILHRIAERHNVKTSCIITANSVSSPYSLGEH